MTRFNCPSCGADVPFLSTDSVTTLCGSCGSLLMRNDVTLENFGKVATLPLDSTPLQIGTIGRWNGKGFSVIGRVRVDWEEGSWNEWAIAFDDGTRGWIGEAQGFWAIYSEVPSALANGGAPLSENATEPERTVLIGNEPFEVEDAREAWVRGIQGELPKKITIGERYRSVDLTTKDGKRTATIALHPKGNEVFVGQWVEFDAFGFTGMKEIHGW